MKKNILIVFNYYYPGFKAGGPIRSIKNICDALGNEFEFYILTTDRDINETDAYPNIITNKWIRFDGYNIYYSKGGIFKLGLIYNEVRIIKPDILYLQSFFNPISWRTIFSSLNYKKKRIIVAPRGEFNKGALLLKKTKKKLFIILSKVFIKLFSIEFQATTLKEKHQINNLFSNVKVWSAGNITDLPIKKLEINKAKENLSIIFVSRISRIKNIEFIIDIFTSHIFKNEVLIDIYGPIEDKGYWNYCIKLSQNLPDNISFNYKGFINYYSLQEIYQSYDLFILPTHGENFGHAIYSALANGLPVVISNNTPWQDLKEHNAGFVLDLDTKKFANVIEHFFSMSDKELINMKKDTLIYAQKYYDLSDSIKNTENMFLG